jgi:hypothetical protein
MRGFRNSQKGINPKNCNSKPKNKLRGPWSASELYRLSDRCLSAKFSAKFDDLNVPFIKDVIQEKSINHHGELGIHSNPILQPLLEQQQRKRLKKLWPADLIDGWRGFIHSMGLHHDTVGTGGRCLNQLISLKNVLNSDC